MTTDNNKRYSASKVSQDANMGKVVSVPMVGSQMNPQPKVKSTPSYESSPATKFKTNC